MMIEDISDETHAYDLGNPDFKEIINRQNLEESLKKYYDLTFDDVDKLIRLAYPEKFI